MCVGDGYLTILCQYQDYIASDGSVTDEWLVAKDSEGIVMTWLRYYPGFFFSDWEKLWLISVSYVYLYIEIPLTCEQGETKNLRGADLWTGRDWEFARRWTVINFTPLYFSSKLYKILGRTNRLPPFDTTRTA
jgi:hypothetical protein